MTCPYPYTPAGSANLKPLIIPNNTNQRFPYNTHLTYECLDRYFLGGGITSCVVSCSGKCILLVFIKDVIYYYDLNDTFTETSCCKYLFFSATANWFPPPYSIQCVDSSGYECSLPPLPVNGTIESKGPIYCIVVIFTDHSMSLKH